MAGAAGDVALTEPLGLKRSARVFFAGDGDGLTDGETAADALRLRVRFSAGEGDVSVAAAGEALVVPAGEAALVVFVFL